MSSKPDIHRLLEFQRLLLQFSQIQRIVDRKQGDAYIPESDTEHSYNLALTAWYLSPYFPELDANTLIRYSLVHDMVEIHAGDTFIYGPQEHLDSKQEREAAALEQLRQEWADFPDLVDTITEYEHRATKESQFIYALDKIMPMMQIYLGDGHTWKRHGIELARVDETKRNKVSGSPEIATYYEQLRELFLQQPDLFASPKG